MPRRLLVLTVYPETAAATRFRTAAYFDALRARGIEPELRPFLPDGSGRIAAGRMAATAARLVALAARRLALLLERGRYDAVLVQREAMPIGPAIIEVLLARAGVPLVLDVDDAVWLEQPGTRYPRLNRVVRRPQKTNDILAVASLVITGNSHLTEYCRTRAPRIVQLPTVVSRDVWTPLPGRLDGDVVEPDAPPTIGWVGTPATGAHLDLVVPALRILAAEGRRFRVRLVGAGRTLPIPGIEVDSAEWSLPREVSDFQRIDVGIAPVVDDAWSRGKSGFKQIQYLTVGVPMVSSTVGGARDFLRHDHNAWLADSTADWVAGLRRLLDDRQLRARFARAGRTLAEERLCTEAQAPAFVDAIESVMKSRGAHG